MKSLATKLTESYIEKSLNIKLNEEKDPLQEYYEKFGETWKETKDMDDDLKQYETDDKTSNLKLDKVFDVTSEHDKEGHYIAKFYGGLNGSGKWRNYIQDILKIVKGIKDSYIVKLEVDVPDDVWTLYLGLQKNPKK
jgi:hypothetical protein